MTTLSDAEVSAAPWNLPLRLPLHAPGPQSRTPPEAHAKTPDGHPNSPGYGHFKLPHLN